MFRKTVVPLILCCAMLGGTVYAQTNAAVATDPSAQQVYDAARSGHLAQAQQMIERVLRAHPDSGRAHYVAAEVYARSGNLARARQELSSAQALQPGLPFVTAASVTQLEQQLASGGAVYRTPPAQPARSFSWGGVLLVVAGIGLLFMLLRRRSPVVNPYTQYPGQSAAYSGVGPYGQPGIGGGMGSGLMGNLATGLAVGAGVAAGEQLVQHMLGSNSQGGVLPAAGASELSDFPPANADMGGSDFGLSDAAGSWDDSGAGDLSGGDMGGGDWT